MPSVEETLRELDGWYNELPGGTERPTYLSKLALLELCGWLEWRFDDLVHTASAAVGVDKDWVEKEVVQATHGFTYNDHLRKMLCRVVGEFALQHVETLFETDNPGKLEQLKGALTILKNSRGVLAHTHSASPVARQQVVNAPSWSINQQRILAKSIDLYESCLSKAFTRTIAKP
jgi:hypothetical protein